MSVCPVPHHSNDVRHTFHKTDTLQAHALAIVAHNLETYLCYNVCFPSTAAPILEEDPVIKLAPVVARKPQRQSLSWHMTSFWCSSRRKGRTATWPLLCSCSGGGDPKAFISNWRDWCSQCFSKVNRSSWGRKAPSSLLNSNGMGSWTVVVIFAPPQRILLQGEGEKMMMVLQT